MNHPKILEACAIGVLDDYRGETVKAYVNVIKLRAFNKALI